MNTVEPEIRPSCPSLEIQGREGKREREREREREVY